MTNDAMTLMTTFPFSNNAFHAKFFDIVSTIIQSLEEDGWTRANKRDNGADVPSPLQTLHQLMDTTGIWPKMKLRLRCTRPQYTAIMRLHGYWWSGVRTSRQKDRMEGRQCIWRR